MSSFTIELGRWYRYWMPDESSIELRTLDGKTFLDRSGTSHETEVIGSLHATKPIEPLESDLNLSP